MVSASIVTETDVSRHCANVRIHYITLHYKALMICHFLGLGKRNVIYIKRFHGGCRKLPLCGRQWRGTSPAGCLSGGRW